MKWNEIRQIYPSQWLLVEALTAHSEEGRRFVEDLAVIDTFADSTAAWTVQATIDFGALTIF